MTDRRILIHTIPPYDGGVPAKTRILCRHLRQLGWDVTVAWYATLGFEPDLVAPSWRPFAAPGCRRFSPWDGVDGVALGCRLPEAEITYYQLTTPWRHLMDGFDRHLAVGGNVLVAHRLVQAKLPHLLWCATPVEDDRVDRRKDMPGWRQILDRALISPALQRMERRVLAETPVIMPVAAYGRRRFTEMGRRQDPVAVLPVPVDTMLYQPGGDAPAGVIGFAGRLSDPRKNVPLLLDAAALLRGRGVPVRLRLAGESSDDLSTAIAARGLDGAVDVLGRLPVEALPEFYRSLDVFAIPSWQEGLGIVGVEAAASGVPVVSTRCGGPADYVEDGVSGFLCGFDAASLADRLEAVVMDRNLRARLAQGARAIAVERFGMDHWAAQLARGWEATWGDRP